ncbi:MAG: septum site-determining protein MinD [Clostridiales bacterium]|nr:septum site-determining protein MinD [Clostridiales bacterium]
MGKVILITSGKGGTGKSTFASNMGALLASEGKSVVLVDMDMGLRTLDIYMGLESKVVYNVYDVVSGLCRIKQALIKDKRFDNLYLMAAAPHRDDTRVTQLHMKVLFRRLAEKFDYVIVDSPAGIDDGFALAAAGADKAVVVTVPEYTAVRDAEVVSALIDSMGIKEKYYVINKVRPEMITSGMIPTIEEINEIIRMPLAGIIQYDENIHIAVNNGLPIVFKQDSYIYENMNNIVKRITE